MAPRYFGSLARAHHGGRLGCLSRPSAGAAHAPLGPRPPLHANARPDSPWASHAAALDGAAALLPIDPDAAALALEGALDQLVRAWYASRRLPLPAPRDLPRDLERRVPSLAWRLRLALRAPNVSARLAHLRGLLAALADQPAATDPSTRRGPARGSPLTFVHHLPGLAPES